MSRADLTVIYDGECPFCTSYVRFLRLRENVGQVELLDARGGDPRVAQVQAMGMDLDAGMVVAWADQHFYGDAAVHILATLSAERGGVLNRIQKMAFASPRRAAWIYPPLALFRRLFLRLSGRSLIASGKKVHHDPE